MPKRKGGKRRSTRAGSPVGRRRQLDLELSWCWLRCFFSVRSRLSVWTCSWRQAGRQLDTAASASFALSLVPTCRHARCYRLPTCRPGQKEPEPRNRTEITENRNRTNRTERTDIKFGSSILRTEINELFSVLHPKEPKNPKKPKVNSCAGPGRMHGDLPGWVLGAGCWLAAGCRWCLVAACCWSAGRWLPLPLVAAGCLLKC
jgi:hypothetical protein